MKKQPKNYHVTITHQYLLEAFDDVEAIMRAKERFLGHKYQDVHFDGMIVNATVTKRIVPKEMIPKPLKQIIKQAAVRIEKEVSRGTKQISRGNRKDTKESDYIHFSPADGI